MLTIRNLTYLQNGTPLLQNVNLQIFAGQRVGLVGRNGCGKSTLFRLIRGEIFPEHGEVELQVGKTIAFVEQEVTGSEQTALAFVLDGDRELRELQKVLASNTHDPDWFEAQHRFEVIDGYGAQARAAQLLYGLGFTQEALDRSIGSFSGGWRMRLNLARALMHRADLLLLDEPTNHLDLEAILWLEQYLARYPGSLMMVSHDREFLNSCVGRIAYIHDRVIDTYSGNYDDFERAHAEQTMQQTQAFQQQQQQIARMEDFVRRFRAKATKAKQAQSRLKALERLVRIAPAFGEVEQYRLRLESPERSPDLLLQAEKMSFGYDSRLILEQVDLSLRAGARIALMGLNGAGKSTLIKLLIGELQPVSGRISINSSIRIGYFAQHQLEHLDSAMTPLQHMQRLAPKESEFTLRTYLGRFGLAGDDENRPVATFSGGEKSRLAFALLAFQKPHVLLLDEPTNHLDLEMRDALTLALEEYTGAVVLVSHDRSLIRAVADELWLVAEGTVRLFEGDLEDYKQWLERRNTRVADKVKPVRVVPKQPISRPNRKALQSKQTKLDAALSLAQMELASINRQLADPATYIDPLSERIVQLNQARLELEKKIEALEEDWLALESAMEACE